ncbi:hypothetical protein HZH68_002896 [Vespula germanica]|uniref:Uncharacterized protein n=1 Tax=Vespula germanica TaxID=30212 RepID=A0A834NN58_VESGE|nr:hypothetical protein HZH68_002896 [Vespula germanica]
MAMSGVGWHSGSLVGVSRGGRALQGMRYGDTARLGYPVTWLALQVPPGPRLAWTGAVVISGAWFGMSGISGSLVCVVGVAGLSGCSGWRSRACVDCPGVRMASHGVSGSTGARDGVPGATKLCVAWVVVAGSAELPGDLFGVATLSGARLGVPAIFGDRVSVARCDRALRASWLRLGCVWVASGFLLGYGWVASGLRLGCVWVAFGLRLVCVCSERSALRGHAIVGPGWRGRILRGRVSVDRRDRHLWGIGCRGQSLQGPDWCGSARTGTTGPELALLGAAGSHVSGFAWPDAALLSRTLVGVASPGRSLRCPGSLGTGLAWPDVSGFSEVLNGVDLPGQNLRGPGWCGPARSVSPGTSLGFP